MMPSRPLPLRRALFAGACLASLASSRSAAATGFVVGTTDAPVTSDAASVVVVREGARTAVTLAVDVSGPAAPMAIVVPVPAEVAKADVHAAPADALAHLDRFTGPRIVETWEQDPCADAGDAGAHDGGSRGPGPAAAPAQSLADKVAAWKARSGGGRVATAAAAVAPTTGDYEVTLLGAADSIALEKWLEKSGYRLPEGAAAKLRPYVEGGSRFVVARIAPEKLAFASGRARLPPLTYTVEGDAPRLALGAFRAGSSGSQDLTVTVIARQRYAPADAAAPIVPTGLPLTQAGAIEAAPFYAALLAATSQRHDRALVTEHVGSVGACTPCAAPPLTSADLAAIGAEVGARAGDAVLPARVTLGAAEVSGTVKDAARGLAGAQGAFLRCYAEALKGAPELRGSLRLTATILDSGEVTTATPQAVQGLPPRLVECLVDRLKEAHFAQLPEGARAGLAVPIRFTPPATVLTPKNAIATRLHARLGKDSKIEDLVLRPAEAAGAPLVASYSVQHPWAGAVACASPKRGAFAGADGGDPKASPIEGVARADTAAVDLAKLVAADVPAIGLDRSAPHPAAPAASASADAPAPAASAPSAPAPAPARGCLGSVAGDRSPTTPAWAIAIAIAVIARMRSRAPRCGPKRAPRTPRTPRTPGER